MLKRSAVLTILALSLSACGADDGVIRIGLIGPLTGDAASFGVDEFHGAELAVKTLNANGGINGRRIELVAEDSQCNGAGAASAMQKVVNVDKVVAVVGGGCSSETLAAAQLAEAKHIPLVSPSASAPSVSTAGDYVFRVYPSDGLKAPAFKNYFEKKKYKKLAMLSENTDFSQGIRAAVAQELAGSSTAIVFDEVVPQGTKDVRSLLSRLKNIDFDIFFINPNGDANVTEAIKQFRALGFKQQIIGADVSDSVNIGKNAPVESEGMLALSIPTLDESSGASKAFAESFRNTWQAPQQGMFFAATGHDAVMVLAEAMKNAGSTDGEKVKQALYALKYNGLIGNISFDTNGDVKGVPFAMKVFKDGVPVQAELIPVE